ncbi:hypothetical protein psal_cds_423 [Pandoravirus salinus]|uniref:Uncharacterized protein n=1 Tax=Pandoravirus salinus TaxID=1349410 RepID=S4W1W8_9VIRU|nr:DNA pol3 gamma3 superfamily incomplete domain [Pandoravirus salinus]AGO84150.1 hypothetical protein psal_cds_423 [Pandoravirus salinus]
MGSDANHGPTASVAKKRRRRAPAAPRARAPNMVGAMAMITLLAVVLVMVVIYFVRRLANVERVVKRTVAEVRHQVTPDDLHTAFGQWVEANPGAVTTACAPYINRSVAVAASAMRVHAPAPQHSELREAPSSSSVQPPPRPHGPASAAPPPQFAPAQPTSYPPHIQQGMPAHAPRLPTGAAPRPTYPPVQTQPLQPRQQQQQQCDPADGPVGAQERWAGSHALDPRAHRREESPRQPPPMQPVPSAVPVAQPARVILPQAGAIRAPPLPPTLAPRQQEESPILRVPPPRMRCHGDVCVIVEDQVADVAGDPHGGFDDYHADTRDGTHRGDPDRPVCLSSDRDSPSLPDDSSHRLSDDHDRSLSDESDVEDGDHHEDGDQRCSTQVVKGQSGRALHVSRSHLDRCVQDTLDAISHASNEEEEDDDEDDEDDIDGPQKGREWRGNDRGHCETGENQSDDQSDDDDDEADRVLEDRMATASDCGAMRAAYADDPWSMPDGTQFLVNHGDESEGDDQDDGRALVDGRGWYDHETPSLFIVLGAPTNGLGAPFDPMGRARITPLEDEDEDDVRADDQDDFLDDDSDSDDGSDEALHGATDHIDAGPAWSVPTNAGATGADAASTHESDGDADSTDAIAVETAVGPAADDHQHPTEAADDTRADITSENAPCEKDTAQEDYSSVCALGAATDSASAERDCDINGCGDDDDNDDNGDIAEQEKDSDNGASSPGVARDDSMDGDVDIDAPVADDEEEHARDAD